MADSQRVFGLIGKNIDYSFSRKFFKHKFIEEQIPNTTYVNFDIDKISDIVTIFKEKKAGYNVTIPYKKQIIPYLDQLSPEAREIGAVNVIQVLPNGEMIGHNTDWYGFYRSLKPLLKPHHQKALILGTGGSSSAISYAFKQLDVKTKFVSRQKKINTFTYGELTAEIIEQHPVIVNTTPLGTFPNLDACPAIPYELLSQRHLLYDLIYNPTETLFLKLGRKQGSTTKNGYEMLVLQAEKSWEIWNDRGLNQIKV